jgi:hypothetical protein
MVVHGWPMHGPTMWSAEVVVGNMRATITRRRTRKSAKRAAEKLAKALEGCGL